MRAASVTKGGQAASSRHHHKALQLHARVATGVAEDLAQLLLQEVGEKQGPVIFFKVRELTDLLVSEILGPFSLRPAIALEGLALLFFADATQLIPSHASQLVERFCRPLGDVEGV